MVQVHQYASSVPAWLVLVTPILPRVPSQPPAAMCEDDPQAGGRVSEQEAAAAQSQNTAASPGCNVQYSTQRRLYHPGKAFYAV